MILDAFVINAEPRTNIGRGLGQLRRQGITPFTLYGKTIGERSLQANTRALERVVQASGLSQLVEVRIGDETVQVLLREVQRHPVAHNLLHVDAYALQMDEKQTLQIPLHTTGQVSSEIPSEYIVIQNMEFITVETFPDRIPDVLEVDLSLLTLEHNIQVRDITLVEGVDFVQDLDEIVVSLARTVSEEEEEIEAEELLDDDSMPLAVEGSATGAEEEG